MCMNEPTVYGYKSQIHVSSRAIRYARSTFQFNYFDFTTKTIQSLQRYDLVKLNTQPPLNFSHREIIVYTYHKVHSREKTEGQNKMHLAGAGQVMN